MVFCPYHVTHFVRDDLTGQIGSDLRELRNLLRIIIKEGRAVFYDRLATIHRLDADRFTLLLAIEDVVLVWHIDFDMCLADIDNERSGLFAVQMEFITLDVGINGMGTDADCHRDLIRPFTVIDAVIDSTIVCGGLCD